VLQARDAQNILFFFSFPFSLIPFSGSTSLASPQAWAWRKKCSAQWRHCAAWIRSSTPTLVCRLSSPEPPPALGMPPLCLRAATCSWYTTTYLKATTWFWYATPPPQSHCLFLVCHPLTTHLGILPLCLRAAVTATGAGTVGATDLLFTIRTLMTMFRRELSFSDGLYLWEVRNAGGMSRVH